MPVASMSVAERIAMLKSIFMNFGITIADNSILDQSITNEFGRGKRSELNQILLDLNQNTEAGALAVCIGTALEKSESDATVKKMGSILRERLPSLLSIIDIRQQAEKRVRLLEQMILHFETKINKDQEQIVDKSQADRLLRMLAASREQLRSNFQIHAVGSVIENTGVILKASDLRICGRVLQRVTPALIALDNQHIPLDQKINLVINAIAAIGHELSAPKVQKAAQILDTVHGLSCMTLPALPEKYTIDQALKKLDISVGQSTLLALQKRALASGLTEKEIAQIIYQNAQSSNLDKQDYALLSATYKNKQHAAACGFLAKLGQDIKCKEIERIGLAGICLASMRQTYIEIKTSNLTPVNFSESLGLIVSSIGILTKNKMVHNIGMCIIEGVKAYAGIMAVPGGQVVAIPLAVCSVLGKMLLSKQNPDIQTSITPEIQLKVLLKQIAVLQNDFRQQFKDLYRVIDSQHHEIIKILDDGFLNLNNYMQYNNIKSMSALMRVDNKIDALQLNVSQEFTELYLEYIRDPINEIDYFTRYQQGDVNQLQHNKIKLSMWLLFKAKHSKVNGRDLFKAANPVSDISNYVSLALDKSEQPESILGLVNKYVNLEFNQSFPEDIPHIPSWVISANTYISLLNLHADNLSLDANEDKVIQDIILVGKQILNFIQELASNAQFWRKIVDGMHLHGDIAYAHLSEIINQYEFNPLRPLSDLWSNTDHAMTEHTTYAVAAADNLQIENFDRVNFELGDKWTQYLQASIPQEFFIAQAYGVGKIQVSYAIDPTVNHFANARVPYNIEPLPDQVRYVLYKVMVHFQLQNNTNSTLILTAWFAYDLEHSCKRFEEYYNLKFKFGLRHKRYLWISLDGMHNQVNGHGESDTHKLIDYTRLAGIYHNWFQLAEPVCKPSIASRLVNHPQFMQEYSGLLAQNSCVQVDDYNITVLQVLIIQQIQNKILSLRVNIAEAVQQSNNLRQVINKLDAYYAVFNAFRHVISPTAVHAIRPSISLLQIVDKLIQPGCLEADVAKDFIQLLYPEFGDTNSFDCNQSELYQTIANILARLGFLSLNLTAPGVMRLTG